eukprot:2969460-Ditylum_brightwellii.AAC.1
MAADLLTIHPPFCFSNYSTQGQNWAVLAVFVAAAMASLPLAKRPFAAQLIVAFVMSMIVCVFIVDLVVDVVMAVLVAAAMTSLALAKRLVAAARHYIPS